MNPVVFFRQGIFCKMMKISFKMIVVIIASRNNIYSHTYKIYLNIVLSNRRSTQQCSVCTIQQSRREQLLQSFSRLYLLVELHLPRKFKVSGLMINLDQLYCILLANVWQQYLFLFSFLEEDRRRIFVTFQKSKLAKKAYSLN